MGVKLELDMAWCMPRLRLFHSERKCRRYLEKLGVEYSRGGHDNATTWFISDGSDVRAVVLMTANADWHAEAALLAHEAVHVAYGTCRELGVEDEEALAYIAQTTAEALFRAHERWKRNHGIGC